MEKVCKCGCGEPTKWEKNKKTFNEFITGHNSKLWKIRKPQASFECTNCKKITVCIPSIANRKFCSRKCRDDYRRLLVGEKNPNFKRFFVQCAKCGITTERKHKHGIKRPVYCSKECGAASKSEKISQAMKARIGDSWNYYRNKARERDGGKCRLCEFTLVTHVHHITHKSKGGKHHINNLITLCPNHHAMAHANLISAEDLLKQIS